MNTQFSEHDDEAQLPQGEAARSDETQAAPAPADEETRGAERHEDTAPVVRKKRAARPAAAGQTRRKRTRDDGIIELRVPTRNVETVKPAVETAVDQANDDLARDELIAQGFTNDEAARIIDLSVRLGTSREARDAEASLRRLRFTRWLVERGVLDEFSA